MTVVLAMLAGGAGALVRGEVARFATSRGWAAQWATGAVNVVGAAVLGALLGGGAADDLLLIAGAGLLGGLTTFSTWMVETVEARRLGTALMNLIIPVAVGVAGAVVGAALAG